MDLNHIKSTINNKTISLHVFKEIVTKYFILKEINSNLILDDVLNYLINNKWSQQKLTFQQMILDINNITFNDIFDFAFEQARTRPFIDLNNLGDLII